MSESEDKCAICDEAGAAVTILATSYRIRCKRCGNYSIHEDASFACTMSQPGFNRALASAWVSEHTDIFITEAIVAGFATLQQPTIGVRARKLLVRLWQSHPLAGERFSVFVAGTSARPLIAASWSELAVEVEYLFVKMLVGQGYVDAEVGAMVAGVVRGCVITPKGHEFIESIGVENTQSNVGFCAMWFHNDLQPVWLQAIQPGIRAAGYEAIRIDGVEHVDKIDDRIIATIRKSRFVVADLTGSRGGVYFEAGFAIGLNIPVVWTVRADRRDADVHFDTRQYNCIGWSPADLAGFSKSLSNRIEAVLGRGSAAMQA